jgi:hypothetical protein
MSEGPTDVGGGHEAGGHAEGEWLPDASGAHQYRYHVHGQPTDFVSDSGVESIDQHAEWRADPAGRHQYRYFLRGQATQAVSDNGVQSTDPVPLTPPQPVDAPPSATRGGPRVWWFLVGGLILGLIIAIGVLALSDDSDDASSPGDSSADDASSPSSTTAECTSPEDFTYSDGACVTGSGAADIGPFTTSGEWTFDVEFSGQTPDGTECSTIGEVVSVWDLASQNGDEYSITLISIFGEGSATVPASTFADGDESDWRVTFENTSQCDWTMTFG